MNKLAFVILKSITSLSSQNATVEVDAVFSSESDAKSYIFSRQNSNDGALYNICIVPMDAYHYSDTNEGYVFKFDANADLLESGRCEVEGLDEAHSIQVEYHNRHYDEIPKYCILSELSYLVYVKVSESGSYFDSLSDARSKLSNFLVEQVKTFAP